MSYQISPDQSQSFQAVRQGFLQVDGLPFSDILSEDRIAQTFEAEDALFGQEADDVYTPALTLPDNATIVASPHTSSWDCWDAATATVRGPAGG